ncbi:type IV pilus assembly protein PilM [Candidatus Dojkabacteria bacterium]|nr:type IV pilus assembly protein PilM [Candidatus Dojkabacteria bacterium]
MASGTPFFALDIGQSSIKLVQIDRKGSNSARLKAIGSINFPNDLETVIPSKEEPEKLELMVSTLKTLIQSSGVKLKQVVTSMPESTIFTKLLPNLPLVDQAKLEEMIYWEAKQVLPIPLEEAQVDWIEIERKKNSDGTNAVSAMVIAAPRSMVEGYLELCHRAELELVALEVESVAIARAFSFTYQGNQPLTMMIDFGADTTNACVVYNGKVIFSQSIRNGSAMFTKAISTDFGIQPSQAEQYKTAYGVLPNQADGGKIYNSIKPVLDVVVNELHKINGFVETRLQYGKPQQILLTGNGSMMPGLAQYIQTALGVNTSIFDPMANLKLTGGLSNIKNEVVPAGYTVAIGLGLKQE